VKIATWNVNSIRARAPRVLDWLAREQPDVLCVQETKATVKAFPFEVFRDAGYHAAVLGQPTYNGVALLAPEAPQAVVEGLGDDVEDPEARLLAAEVRGLRILTAYVPNGREVGSEKWAYKLSWLARLRRHLHARYDPAAPLLLCGDLNIAPEDRDVANPEAWRESVLCHAEARAAFRELLEWGLIDAFRRIYPGEAGYTWWDYRRLAFPRNDGLRIDHVLVTEPLAGRLEAVEVHRDERKGKQPSDHVPVAVVLRD
jgi:exodeoxyribonuclease-3